MKTKLIITDDYFCIGDSINTYQYLDNNVPVNVGETIILVTPITVKDTCTNNSTKTSRNFDLKLKVTDVKHYIENNNYVRQLKCNLDQESVNLIENVLKGQDVYNNVTLE